MEELDFNTLLEMEDIIYQFKMIEQIILILRENYFSKNDVDYKKVEDFYDLCVGYKGISTLLDVIKDTAEGGYSRYEKLLNITKKEIENK